ncbi:hypothetical protein ACQKEX_14805 [Bacillus pumilus]|uniref:hypothetical protein n=1 Tax=Bacillaceae TaxID=186817 RepID=UPI00096786CA|nr:MULTISPECIES: hypothetical protein [Bacillaceae]MBU8576398.1 hypothetical protein [Bacillus pumilus]OLP64403.1 hypothetical protein BACPU_26280 [Bacillus pumilus]TYS40485.1 hypothetical protein FZC68_16890 [Bacillus pumilus]
MKRKVSEVSRKERSDKKIRVNAALPKEVHDKLKKLAIACDKDKTPLAAEILEIALNNESVVNWFQTKYNKDEAYRIIVVKSNGNVHYS